jgi:hypothetical protein
MTPLLSAGWLGLLLVMALTAPVSLWLLLPLVTLPAAVRWHTELACDRMAVEAVGPVPARMYVDYYSEALERARSRPLPRRLIWWIWDRFTYPPWRVHHNAIAGVIAKQERASPRARLASWTDSAGDAAAAREQYAARLPIREQALGPDHPDTLTMRHELARSTGDAGDAAAARDQFTALLPIRERTLGPDHPDTLTTRHDIADWTGQAGNARAALQLCIALLHDQQRVQGPDHPHTSAARLNLAYWTAQAAAAEAQQLPPQMIQLRAWSDPPRTRLLVVHIGGYSRVRPMVIVSDA